MAIPKNLRRVPELRLSLRPERLFFLGLYMVCLGAGAALAGQDFEAYQPNPVITNSNPDATAYFWIKKGDGRSEIIAVLPKSKKRLPSDVLEFQYLYMEGGKYENAIPDIPWLQLTDSENPDGYVSHPPPYEKIREIGKSPPPAQDQQPLLAVGEKVRGQDQAEKDAAPLPAPPEKQPLSAKGGNVEPESGLTRVINLHSRAVVIRVMTTGQKMIIFVLSREETLSLPPESDKIMLVSEASLEPGKEAKPPRIKIEKGSDASYVIDRHNLWIKI